MTRFISLLFISILALSLLSTSPALAQDPLGLDYGKASGLGDTDVRSTAASIITVLLSLLGTIALVLIVYAGFLWMTSAGNDDQVGKAKQILSASIIGLLIILMAYSITKFVVSNLSEVTGVNQPAQP